MTEKTHDQNRPAFKLAHLSDLHLDYSSGKMVNAEGVNIREQDGYDAFNGIVDDIIAHEVDAAMIAGDIFHSPKPTIRSIVQAQQGLKKLADAGIKVYSIAGNHDASDIRSDVAASKVLDRPEIGIFSHAEPYVKYEISEGIHIHLVSHHMYSQQQDTLLDVNPVPGQVNIFCTHGSIIDSITKMRLSTEQSPREIIIPDFILNEKDWSYRLLGHVHERGFAGSSDGKQDTAGLKTYYNGSLIRRGFSDALTPLGRGWTLWSIDSAGNFTPEFKQAQQRAQFDFESIDCGELSSADISTLIIENLKTTKDSQLPILRQSLHNLSPAKHGALDWSTINKNTGHALGWKMNIERTTLTPSPPKKDETIADNDDEGSEESTEAVQEQEMRLSNDRDLLEIYDDFAELSQTAQEIEEELRPRSVKMSRKFIHSSRQRSLGSQED